MGIYDAVEEAMKELKIDLDIIREEERDAGLEMEGLEGSALVFLIQWQLSDYLATAMEFVMIMVF